MKDKIRGMFLGTAIGDSLGMCCEGWSAEKIKEVYGRITKYYDPTGHKYHQGAKAGTWTDDTKLTLCVAESLIEAGKFDLLSQVEHHVKAYNTHTGGWGKTTREAIGRLATGVHWRDAGCYSPDGKRGFGNGVAMKAAPIGAYLAGRAAELNLTDKLADFAGMTHRTSMGVSSCLAQVHAAQYCLECSPANFVKERFVTTVVNASELGKQYFRDTLTDDITERFKLLYSVTPATTPEEIIDKFGKGSYYVYDSLPFTYAFLLRNQGIDSLYDCVSGGGDCDSNGSMLGSLLGALHGTAVFPQELVDGLGQKSEIVRVSDAFWRSFYEN